MKDASEELPRTDPVPGELDAADGDPKDRKRIRAALEQCGPARNGQRVRRGSFGLKHTGNVHASHSIWDSQRQSQDSAKQPRINRVGSGSRVKTQQSSNAGLLGASSGLCLCDVVCVRNLAHERPPVASWPIRDHLGFSHCCRRQVLGVPAPRPEALEHQLVLGEPAAWQAGCLAN
eukprot:55985-Amphidinium_carterae.1